MPAWAAFRLGGKPGRSRYSLFRSMHSLFGQMSSLFRTELGFCRNTLELQRELTPSGTAKPALVMRQNGAYVMG